MEIRRIELEKLVENDWNPNRMTDDMKRALVKSIREGGFVQPLVVRPKGDAYQILDGAHRFHAMREIGAREAECVVVRDPDEAARVRTLVLNRIRGSFDNEALARVLAGLPLDDDAVRESLAYSERELDEIRSLLEKAPGLKLEVPEEEQYELIDFYLAPDEAEVVHEALDTTGEGDRAKALVAVAKGYLDARADQ